MQREGQSRSQALTGADVFHEYDVACVYERAVCVVYAAIEELVQHKDTSEVVAAMNLIDHFQKFELNLGIPENLVQPNVHPLTSRMHGRRTTLFLPGQDQHPTRAPVGCVALRHAGLYVGSNAPCQPVPVSWTTVLG